VFASDSWEFAVPATDIESIQESSIWKMTVKTVFDDMIVPVEVMGVNLLRQRKLMIRGLRHDDTSAVSLKCGDDDKK
jgi:hypothetical protein